MTTLIILTTRTTLTNLNIFLINLNISLTTMTACRCLRASTRSSETSTGGSTVADLAPGQLGARSQSRDRRAGR